jgi:hypothetical protein
MKQRLQFVRQYISSCLNACPPGKIRVVSVCAGDGRDLLGALIDHPRASDVYARLVELDQRLVECGRAAAESAELGEQFEFVQGDATMSSVYEGGVPADLVLVCGVFGNLPPLEVHRLVRSLCCLCKHGGFVIWTRGLFEAGDDSITIVRELLGESEFEEVSFKTTPNGRMGVGTHRYFGQTLPLPYDQQLFVFSSPLEIQEG